MGQKKSVYLIAGPLGAGKTTLINKLLQILPPPVALVENEFGDINIDQESLKGQEDLIIEMNNGCLCCSVRGDLIVSLRELLKRNSQFETLIIESTGMADPGPIKESFIVDPVLKQEFELKSVVTVIDALNFEKQLSDLDDEYRQTFHAQMIFADAFYLSKKDLLSDEQSLENILCELNEFNQFAPSLENLADVEAIESLSLEGKKIASHNHSHSPISALSVEFAGVINHSLLEMFLSTLVMRYRGKLYRGKGVLSIKGQTHKVIFQNVYESFDFQLGRAWDPEVPENERVNQFVFIGIELNRELIEKGLRQCLLGANP